MKIAIEAKSGKEIIIDTTADVPDFNIPLFIQVSIIRGAGSRKLIVRNYGRFYIIKSNADGRALEKAARDFKETVISELLDGEEVLEGSWLVTHLTHPEVIE